ncbi:hypothetical protein ACFLQ6_11045 [Thermoproteota archaeon]
MSIHGRKYYIKSTNISKDTIISLANIVDNTTSQLNETILRSAEGKIEPHSVNYKPKYSLEGGTIELKFESLESMKSENWPTDTKRIIFSSPEIENHNTVSIDISYLKGGAAIIRGDDDWARATSKKIEEIIEPRRSVLVDYLHREWGIFLISFLLSLTLVSYVGYIANRIQFWWIFMNVGYLIIALVISAAIGLVLTNPLGTIASFLYPYVEFSWNDWRRRNTIRKIFFFILGLIITGMVWEQLSRLIVPQG